MRALRATGVPSLRFYSLGGVGPLRFLWLLIVGSSTRGALRRDGIGLFAASNKTFRAQEENEISKVAA